MVGVSDIWKTASPANPFVLPSDRKWRQPGCLIPELCSNDRSRLFRFTKLFQLAGDRNGLPFSRLPGELSLAHPLLVGSG